tara:strand:- start:31557 stop:32627 length:1071 start_codon:yes stop_codon:yes gene_type:complete
MSNEFKIGTKKVGGDNPVFIIAEAGANHNGDLKLAKELAFQAKEIGCDCIKYQTFTAEEFCADPEQLFSYKSQGKEVTESMLDLFKRLELKKNEWNELISYCNEIGIHFMTTVQDPSNLEMLLEIGIDSIKVGSDDFDHIINLITYAKTGLPLIISRGMADLAEIDTVIRKLEEHTDKIIVLHCVSLYPTEPIDLNLKQIERLKTIYPDIIWGFSDHSEGTLAPVLAACLGAKVIEKHFTLDHELPGPDHWFSMDIEQMKKIVSDIRLAEKMMGHSTVKISDGEKNYKNIARRRIVAKKDIDKGDFLSVENISFKRCSNGIFVKEWDMVEGAVINKTIKKNNGINYVDIEFTSSQE